MKKIKLTVAQAIVLFLDNQYIIDDNKKETKFIEGILGIFGHGNVVGLGEALAHQKHNLKFHQAYNEQSMGHIAMGFAKQNKNKKIYAVTSSVGPGAANMVTAAATASANRIPVLYLPGDTFASRQPDPVLQQIEHYNNSSITTNDAFKAVSVYWDRIDRPEKLMSAMINAMSALLDFSNQGAVTIALPQDVQGEVYDFPISFLEKRIHKIYKNSPNKEDISNLLEAIKNSKQPLIVCGGGVIYSEAEKELEKFSELFNIPIAETQAGKSAIKYDNEWNLGGIGTTGFVSANKYAKDADLVIGLGTRYTDFTTASKSLFKENSVFYNINISRFDAKKMEGYMILADIKKTLQKLNIIKFNNLNANIKNLVDKYKKEANQEILRLGNIEVEDINNFQPEVNDSESKRQIQEFYKITNSKMTQTQALCVINDAIDEDAIVVGSAGSLPGDLQRMWKPKMPNTYHVEYGYSCMGYEIAGSLGVKFAKPNKEVYTMVGDGSYMMLHSALLTSIQESKKINVVLFNNSSFGCINNLQVDKGIASLGTEFLKRKDDKENYSHAIMHVNYSEQAKPYGVKTYRVHNKKELILAIEDSKKQEKSVLIEVLVLPKTMTHGYESWWRVGNAQVSSKDAVLQETKKDLEVIKKLRGY